MIKKSHTCEEGGAHLQGLFQALMFTTVLAYNIEFYG